MGICGVNLGEELMQHWKGFGRQYSREFLRGWWARFSGCLEAKLTYKKVGEKSEIIGAKNRIAMIRLR